MVVANAFVPITQGFINPASTPTQDTGNSPASIAPLAVSSSPTSEQAGDRAHVWLNPRTPHSIAAKLCSLETKAPLLYPGMAHLWNSIEEQRSAVLRHYLEVSVAPEGVCVAEATNKYGKTYARAQCDRAVFGGKKTMGLGRAGSPEHRAYEQRIAKREALAELGRLEDAARAMVAAATQFTENLERELEEMPVATFNPAALAAAIAPAETAAEMIDLCVPEPVQLVEPEPVPSPEPEPAVIEQAPKPKKVLIRIAKLGKEPKEFTVPSLYSKGGLCVLYRGEFLLGETDYNVTHERSGLSAYNAKTESAARAVLAAMLETGIDWLQDLTPDVSDEMRAALAPAKAISVASYEKPVKELEITVVAKTGSETVCDGFGSDLIYDWALGGVEGLSAKAAEVYAALRACDRPVGSGFLTIKGAGQERKEEILTQLVKEGLVTSVPMRPNSDVLLYADRKSVV
jgi:hypothetical protein